MVYSVVGHGKKVVALSFIYLKKTGKFFFVRFVPGINRALALDLALALEGEASEKRGRCILLSQHTYVCLVRRRRSVIGDITLDENIKTVYAIIST